MKHRTKKKHIHQYWTTKKQREKNKELCKRYPFLIPRSVWTDEIIWDMKWNGKKEKAYNYTLVDDFPDGWWRAFGIQLCEELREDLIKCNYLYQFRFEQIKSKYGQLRAYTGPLPKESNAWNIIEDYSKLSENICEHCGKPDQHILNYGGWIICLCENCYYKMEGSRKKNITKATKKDKYIIPSYESYILKDAKNRMADERTITRYIPGGVEETVTYDLRVKAEAIRIRWAKTHE